MRRLSLFSFVLMLNIAHPQADIAVTAIVASTVIGSPSLVLSYFSLLLSPAPLLALLQYRRILFGAG